MRPSDRLPLACLLAALAVTALSRIGARDPSTWLMEVAPTLIALPLLVASYRRFRFTPLVYVALAIHAAILATGAHWTYADVPLGFWVRDAFGLARNHYDRLGHLAQGFVPALVARELLLRTSPIPWIGAWACPDGPRRSNDQTVCRVKSIASCSRRATSITCRETRKSTKWRGLATCALGLTRLWLEAR